MAKKKKDEGHDPEEVFNPYYGRATDPSKMAKHPLFTWIMIIPCALAGLAIGFATGEFALSVAFGAIMGIASGTMIDNFIYKRKHRDDEEEDAE